MTESLDQLKEKLTQKKDILLNTFQNLKKTPRPRTDLYCLPDTDTPSLSQSQSISNPDNVKVVFQWNKIFGENLVLCFSLTANTKGFVSCILHSLPGRTECNTLQITRTEERLIFLCTHRRVLLKSNWFVVSFTFYPYLDSHKNMDIQVPIRLYLRNSEFDPKKKYYTAIQVIPNENRVFYVEDLYRRFDLRLLYAMYSTYSQLEVDFTLNQLKAAFHDTQISKEVKEEAFTLFVGDKRNVLANSLIFIPESAQAPFRSPLILARSPRDCLDVRELVSQLIARIQ